MKIYTALRVLNVGLLFLFVQSEPYFSNEFKQHHYENSQGSGQSLSKAKMRFDCIDPEERALRNIIGISFTAHPCAVVMLPDLSYASSKVQAYIRDSTQRLKQSMYEVVASKHYAALPGYHGDRGLLSLISDFVPTNKYDSKCVDYIVKRFESYKNCIDNIIFDGRHCFKEVLSEKDRELLAWAYIFFVEEFASGDVHAEIRHLAQNDIAFACVYKKMCTPELRDTIKNYLWSFAGGNDYYCRQSVSDARDAATGHGALGQIYRLVEEKRFDEARALLDKHIAYKKWFLGRTLSQSVR